eukprot:823282-Pyramimonas_sp.AAC.1
MENARRVEQQPAALRTQNSSLQHSCSGPCALRTAACRRQPAVAPAGMLRRRQNFPALGSDPRSSGPLPSSAPPPLPR